MPNENWYTSLHLSITPQPTSSPTSALPPDTFIPGDLTVSCDNNNLLLSTVRQMIQCFSLCSIFLLTNQLTILLTISLSPQRAWDMNALHQRVVQCHFRMAVPHLGQQATSTYGLMEQESFLQLTLPILVDGIMLPILNGEADVVEVCIVICFRIKSEYPCYDIISHSNITFHISRSNCLQCGRGSYQLLGNKR